MARGSEPKKRGRRGQGSVYQRGSDNLWCARVRKDKRTRTAYARTKAEAREKLREMLESPVTFAPAQTLATFLDSWYESEVAGHVRYGTDRSYRRALRLVTEHLGIGSRDANAHDLAKKARKVLHPSSRDRTARGARLAAECLDRLWHLRVIDLRRPQERRHTSFHELYRAELARSGVSS